ncbi:hypothetical protein MSPP1_003251 [Malassezia sp. CBS 17886]|nr:hypothetical protein MSPP1_003251 [Malassezia sp. CBS 17886]
MFKGSKAAQYAQELSSARLKGAPDVSDGESVPAEEAAFADLLRRVQKHNPALANTVAIASTERELLACINAFFREQAYRDASHAQDSAARIAFPPVMEDGTLRAEKVQQSIGQLSDLETLSQEAAADAVACEALSAYGMLVLGLDEQVASLVTRAKLLDAAPSASAETGAADEHRGAMLILAAAVYGIACERLTLRADAAVAGALLQDALRAYTRANAIHEQLRGGPAARTTPFVDEMERWTETALYRHALLSLRLYGEADGAAALRTYQAKESRWPSTFRIPQRNALRALHASALNRGRVGGSAPALGAVAGGAAGGAAAVAAAPLLSRTVSRRRPHPSPPRNAPSDAWSKDFVAIKQSATRTLENTRSLPRADESSANAERLAEQLVLSWRLDGARGSGSADEVVDLLYGLMRITFRSSVVLRLLTHMLVAAEAYREAVLILGQYMHLVESAWKAAGGPQTEESAIPGFDNGQHYIDAVLLGAHVYFTYLDEPQEAARLAQKLRVLVGDVDRTVPHADVPADEGETPPQLYTVAPALLARILRSAGRSKAMAAMKLPFPATRARDLTDGRALLERAVLLDAEASETYYALGYVTALQRDMHAALAAARRALELEPASLDAWHLVILLLSAQKDFCAARDLAEEALAIAESDDAADAGPQTGAAPSALTQLVSFDYPPSPRERAEAYLRLLITHNTLEELTEGVQSALQSQQELFAMFQMRLASDPVQGEGAPTDDARALLAVSHQRSAAAKDAALATAPPLRRDAGVGLSETPAAARAAFRAARECRLLQTLWLLSAASFRRAGDLEQSRFAIEEAEQRDALCPDVWVQLALWCVDAEKSGPAVTCLYKALACQTDHVPAAVHLARLFLQPARLHLSASHAESIAAVATAQNGSEELMRLSLLGEGIGTEAETDLHACRTSSRSLGAREGSAHPGIAPVAPGFAWAEDPLLPPLSMAEALLRTATLYRGWDVPEAWQLLAQLSSKTGRPLAEQRQQLHKALCFEDSRTIRPLAAALALP